MERINFRTYDWVERPRLLWQRLFNKYREWGGDLSNMSNLLIDYESCKKLFHNFDFNIPRRVIFAMSPSHYMTAWKPLDGWQDSDIEWFTSDSLYDGIILVELTGDEASLKVLRAPQ